MTISVYSAGLGNKDKCVFVISYLSRPIRALLWFHPQFFGAVTVDRPGLVLVQMAERVHISRQFHGLLHLWSQIHPPATNSHNGTPMIIKCHNQITHIGSTSYIWRITFEGPHAEIYIDIDYLMVVVDKTTRKPKPVLSEQRQKFRTPSLPRQPRKLIPKPDAPKHAHVLFAQITEEDIDLNGHTTHPVYIGLIFNCIEEAIIRGKLHATLQILEPMKTFECCYQGESLADDVLHVRCWHQTPKDSNDTIYFQIQNQGAIIVYGSLQVFTEPMPKAML